MTEQELAVVESYERGFMQGQQKGMEEGYNQAIDKARKWILHTAMYAKQPNQLVDDFCKVMEE